MIDVAAEAIKENFHPGLHDFGEACCLYYFLHEGEAYRVKGFLEIYTHYNATFAFAGICVVYGIIQQASYLTHVPPIHKAFLPWFNY